MTEKKIIVFGLDCATPQFVFEKYASRLPNLAMLMKKGTYGPLKSCIPPITVPAWSCMMTGKTPGHLGCYGYRNRHDYSYDGLSFSTSKSIKADRVWDILSKKNKKVVLVGVPQTYPPTALNGVMLSCFLTPDTTCRYTYPAELASEIEACFDKYILDVENFRTENKDVLLKKIYEMTKQRFNIFKYLLETKPWDFAMMVDMGIDRIQHVFWKYADLLHPEYEEGNPYEHAILDLYKFIDCRIGEIIAETDADTAVMVVSDHGAKTMKGGFCINEWLIKENYLVIADKPEGVVPIDKTKIDWSKTIAWAEGGHYARVFLNVKAREPHGLIPWGEYEQVRSELKAKLEATEDDGGSKIGTKVYKPEDIYPETNGIPPDLMVYAGNLEWRSIGSVGHDSLFTLKNDLGPDDANHSDLGIFIMFDPACTFENSNGTKTFSIYDIAPTVLNTLGLPVPADMAGKPVQARVIPRAMEEKSLENPAGL